MSLSNTAVPKYYGVITKEGLVLSHHGIKGQKWGVRRFQDNNGSLTKAGYERYYGNSRKKMDATDKKIQQYIKTGKAKVDNLKNYDNIHLQADAFGDMSKLSELLENITGSRLETHKLDIDNQNFLTYSYVCIDQQLWNEQKDFENIESYYTKFARIHFLSAQIKNENPLRVFKNTERNKFLLCRYFIYFCCAASSGFFIAYRPRMMSVTSFWYFVL